MEEDEQLIILDTYDPYADEGLEHEYEEFFGKKARARRARRREERHQRKLEKISLRGQNRVNVATAGGGIKGIVSSLGEGLGSAAKTVFGGEGDPMSAILGGIGGGGGSLPEGEMYQNQNQDGMKKTIIFGVVALLVIGGIILYVRSKKNA